MSNSNIAETLHADSLEVVGDGWILFRKISEYPKQDALALAAGLDAGTLSAFKHNKGAVKISNLKLLLKALNLKLVNADSRCVKESTFRELTSLAARALEQPQLLWEDDGE
jgi:transcriptional regulator with XRE-family HTH domain